MRELDTAGDGDGKSAETQTSWERLDEIWLALPLEAKETAKLIIWIKSFEGDTNGSGIDMLSTFIPQTVGAIFGLEKRVMELESELKRLKG